MFHQLVSHNDDLRRLMEKGFAFSIDGGYLVVRDIPYLDDQKQSARWGAFVAKLEFIDKLTVKQDDHQIWFSGSVPHGLDDESPFPTSVAVRQHCRLAKTSKDVIVQRSFSNKPTSTWRVCQFFRKDRKLLDDHCRAASNGAARRQSIHVSNS